MEREYESFSTYYTRFTFIFSIGTIFKLGANFTLRVEMIYL